MFYLDNMAIQFPFAKAERVPMRMSFLIFLERALTCDSMVHRLRRRLSRARPPSLGRYIPPVSTQIPRQLFRACGFADYDARLDRHHQKCRWSSATGSD